nr:bacterial transcriptional activator domain-containing protein [Nocardiopsis salina]
MRVRVWLDGGDSSLRFLGKISSLARCENLSTSWRVSYNGKRCILLIRLSGIVTVELQSKRPWRLTSSQAQAAFARLVLDRGRGTSRGQLAETIWPETLPKTWASALRSVVSRVRSFVDDLAPNTGDVALTSQGGCYLLTLPPCATVDLEHAEDSLVQACAELSGGGHEVAYRIARDTAASLRGSFLSEHGGEWVASVRERVDGLRLAALEIASLTSSSLRNAPRALEHANEAIRHSPFRESAHQCRIMAHAAAGNRAEALGAYHELRQLLAEELGIDPAPEIQAMYLDLLHASECQPWESRMLGAYGSLVQESRAVFLNGRAADRLSGLT